MRFPKTGFGLTLGTAVAVLALIAAVFGRPAPAAAALTAKDVKAALAATAELRPLHEKYEQQLVEYAKTIKQPQPGDDPCKLTPEVKGSPGFGEMEKVMKKSGFPTAEAYCRTMSELVRAYMAVRVEEQAPMLEQKLQEARAQIEADPNMKPEEKEQLLARLTEHPMIRAARAVPETDKKLVAEFRPQLDAALLPPPGAAPPGAPHGAGPGGSAPPPQ